MLLFRLIPPRASSITRLSSPMRRLHSHGNLNKNNNHICSSSSPQLRLSIRRQLTQCRSYAQQSAPPKTSRILKEDELKRQAKAAASNPKRSEIPERLLIYHAGTGRITAIAMLKLTTVLLGAFFTFMVVPGYVKAKKPVWETVGVALCGLTPILFIAYTTAPFVTHIHIHLPPQARTSRAVLERFVAKSLPPSTRLTLTTMSPIAKPRYSDIPAGELAPARARLGIVNYVRGHGAAADENESRRWYMFRAVRQFYVQERGEEKKVRYQKKAKSMVDGWIWDAIKGKIAQKDAAAKTV